jgi:hypothetical protein
MLGEKVNLDWLPPLEDNGDKCFYLLGFGTGIRGTLCICEPKHSKNDEPVLLWSPAIKDSLIVPPTSYNAVDVPSYNEFKVRQYGFGYDHVRIDYKLIRCINFWVSIS